MSANSKNIFGERESALMSIHPYVVLLVLVRDKACSCFATNFLDHQTLSMLQYELLKAICLSD